MRDEMATLRAELAVYKNMKNSNSIPSCKDENLPEKNKSLRGDTGKRSIHLKLCEYTVS